jgi:hypothetical protein
MDDNYVLNMLDVKVECPIFYSLIMERMRNGDLIYPMMRVFYEQH